MPAPMKPLILSLAGLALMVPVVADARPPAPPKTIRKAPSKSKAKAKPAPVVDPVPGGAARDRVGFRNA